MAQHRIRTWLAKRLQRSPKVNDYLLGAGSVMTLFPLDDEAPALRRSDRDALTADIRAVGRDMGVAYLRADKVAQHTATVGAHEAAIAPDATPHDEQRADWRRPVVRQAAASATARG
jgi:hypothetical protein